MPEFPLVYILSGKKRSLSLSAGYEFYNEILAQISEQVPGRPTRVQIKFRVQDVTAVNDVDFSVTMYAYIVLRWTEPRLNRNRSADTTLGWNAVDTRFSKYESEVTLDEIH